MQIEILKSKVHRAVITEANLSYVGSLTLDEDLMDAANMIENEKIHVVNVNNGERIETTRKDADNTKDIKTEFDNLVPKKSTNTSTLSGNFISLATEISFLKY